MKKWIKNFISLIVFMLVFILMIFSFKHENLESYDWYYSKLGLNNLENETTNTLAIIDSGYCSKAGFNEDVIVGKYNAIDNSDNVEDTNGHGTALLSLAIGLKNELYEIKGINPHLNILIIKVVSDNGKTTPQLVSKGINYAVDNGADIINISLGTMIDNDELKKSINYAYNNEIIIVSSIGDNQENDVSYPSRYNNVIAIGAQMQNGEKYILSNLGKCTAILPGIDISVYTYDSILNSWEIRKNTGSSIAAIIFSSILSAIYTKGIR